MCIGWRRTSRSARTAPATAAEPRCAVHCTQRAARQRRAPGDPPPQRRLRRRLAGRLERVLCILGRREPRRRRRRPRNLGQAFEQVHGRRDPEAADVRSVALERIGRVGVEAPPARLVWIKKHVAEPMRYLGSVADSGARKQQRSAGERAGARRCRLDGAALGEAEEQDLVLPRL